MKHSTSFTISGQPFEQKANPLSSVVHRASACLFLLFFYCASATGREAETNWINNWNFKFRDFAIGAWWGPGGTDAEVKLYKEAGFNVVMVGRYMVNVESAEAADYANPDKVKQNLDLAQKYNLGAMLDTYTKNDRPWGGLEVTPDPPHRIHHPCSLDELKWLHARFGQHPALIGYMIGDDIWGMGGRPADCTKFLKENAPTLFPWLCGVIAPSDLAAHGNPIENPQIFPTLYRWGDSAEQHVGSYCREYDRLSRECRKHGVKYFWPMFNAAPPMTSDSLLRFPAYAAVAYGAKGIWYFCYNGGSLQQPGQYTTEDEVRKALTPLYPVAQQVNRRLAGWGPMVMERKCAGLFGTALLPGSSDWPFPETIAREMPSPAGQAVPIAGKLIESMSDNLLVGILTKDGTSPLAVVVNSAVSKSFNGLPERSVKVKFVREVRSVSVWDGGAGRIVPSCEVELRMEPGGGQLLQLTGDGLDKLCATEAIYARPAVTTAMTGQRLAPGGLEGIKAAKLRMDVFGADAQPPFNKKFLALNGKPLGRVPASNGDAWTVRVVDVPVELLKDIRIGNIISITGATRDAWKFCNLTLAIQRADGTWIKSSTDSQIRCHDKNWAHAEGEPVPASGIVEVGLSFPP